MIVMKISQNGLEELEISEGLELKQYKDTGGKWTIGIGHLITPKETKSGKIIIDGVPVDYLKGITKDQAYKICDQDVDIAEKAVNSFVKVKLNQNQFDALVSFVFNVGVEAFRKSTLLKVLNKGDFKGVRAQLKRWVYDDGRVIPGLANRREREADLFELACKV